MTKLIFTTVYDDVLHHIETMTHKTIDYDFIRYSKQLKNKVGIIDKKYGYTEILLFNDTIVPQVEKLVIQGSNQFTNEKLASIRKLMLQQGILFSAQDIIIYRILISHFINYQVNGVATITIDEIHHKYRGKAFKYSKGDDRYDKKTLNAYIRTLKKLNTINLTLRFAESKLKAFNYLKDKGKTFMVQKLLNIQTPITSECVSSFQIKYDLGMFGEYLTNSRQYGQLLPKEIYELNFNQIDTFNMAIYLSRMIVMNRRKKSYTVYVSRILSRIIKYNTQGYSTGITYFDYLKMLEPVKRNKKIKHIEEQLTYILELLKEKKCISNYQYSSKFQYKYIKAEELAIKLYFSKWG